MKICKDDIYNKSINNLSWKYDIGEKLIYNQSNCYYDRLVGCEVIKKCYSKNFDDRNRPFYKVKVYTENITIWTIAEDRFECTYEELGEFPRYDKNIEQIVNEIIDRV